MGGIESMLVTVWVFFFYICAACEWFVERVYGRAVCLNHKKKNNVQAKRIVFICLSTKKQQQTTEKLRLWFVVVKKYANLPFLFEFFLFFPMHSHFFLYIDIMCISFSYFLFAANIQLYMYVRFVCWTF